VLKKGLKKIVFATKSLIFRGNVSLAK